MLQKYLLNASAISTYSTMSQIYSFFMICFISLSIFIISNYVDFYIPKISFKLFSKD